MATHSPDRQTTPKFNATAVLLFLVALPLAALVILVLVSTLGTKDEENPRAALKAKTKEPAKTMAVEVLPPTSKDGDKTAQPLTAAEELKGEKKAESNQPAVKTTAPQPQATAVASRPPPWQAVLDTTEEPPNYTKGAFLPF